MNNGYWQTKKQGEQFRLGKTLTAKIARYIQTWKRRCYSNGIPDVVPDKLAKTGRAPSYKAVAIAILKNDASLSTLGCSTDTSEYYSMLKKNDKACEGGLFDEYI